MPKSSTNQRVLFNWKFKIHSQEPLSSLSVRTESVQANTLALCVEVSYFWFKRQIEFGKSRRISFSLKRPVDYAKSNWPATFSNIQYEQNDYFEQLKKSVYALFSLVIEFLWISCKSQKNSNNSTCSEIHLDLSFGSLLARTAMQRNSFRIY